MKMQHTNKGHISFGINALGASLGELDNQGMCAVYLKKIEGPRTVTLPNGDMMSRSDLPAVSTKRWVASRKIAVVRGVLHGLISKEEALEMYGLSEEEFLSWCSAVADFGEKALKATAVQKYRQL